MTYSAPPTVLLLLRILAPQIAALIVWAAVRFAARDRDPIISQLAAVAIAAVAAVWVATMHGAFTLSGPRLGAFIALELFVALLAQLLIIAREES